MGADAPNMGLWVRPENIAIHEYSIQMHDMKSVHGFWPDFLLKTSRFKGNALLVHPHKIRDINFTRVTLYCFEHKGQKNILGTIQEIRKWIYLVMANF